MLKNWLKIMTRYAGFLLLLLLSACISKTREGLFIEKLVVTTDHDANMYSPTEIEVVVSYDPRLTDQLTNMTARQYFKAKKQLQHDYFGRIYNEGWELPPNFSVTEAIYHHPLGVHAVFLFADYCVPGVHKLRLVPAEIVHVRIMRTGLLIQSSTHEKGYHESNYQKPDMTVIDNRKMRLESAGYD